MQKWEKLKAGDIIDVIAPGYPVRPEVVVLARDFLSSRGFVPRIPADLLSPQYFHSNSDMARLAQAKAALLAKDSKAIWCLRGGYGSNRLLPALSKLKRPAKAKVFIGISDVTSLHLFLNQKWKWCTLHACLLDRFAEKRISTELTEEIFDVLSGEKKEVLFTGLRALNPKAVKTKNRKANIVGGNLTTLQSAIGTPWSMKSKEHFLFLEDLGERGYRIDRMLVHLQQSGALKSCQGILFGQFIGGEEPVNTLMAGVSRAQEAIQRFADENSNLPMWSGIESGHGELLRALPFGTMATLKEKNAAITLSVETGCR